MRRRNSKARTPDAIQFAREQRKQANQFSKIAWEQLRNRRCYGYKFRREFPIPPYTADFCCVELKLIVEIDGEDHFTPQGQLRDQKRDSLLRQKGFEVVRIPGFQLLNELQQALNLIGSAIKKQRQDLAE